MRTATIPLEECLGIIEKARDIYSDRRANLELYAWHIQDALLQFANHKSITQQQYNRLEQIYNFYEKLRRLNDGYEDGFRERAINSLNKAINYLSQFGDKPFKLRVRHIKKKAERIRNGQYFWKAHFQSAYFLLLDLKEHDEDNRELCEIIGELTQIIERTDMD